MRRRPGVRLWGQDELSCRPPAAPATSSQQRTDGWAAMPDGGCLHPWRPTERQGIIGLRPAIWKILIVTRPSHRARCLHTAFPLCLKRFQNYNSKADHNLYILRERPIPPFPSATLIPSPRPLRLFSRRPAVGPHCARLGVPYL